MSECVVRMKMPKSCDECPMEYDGFMCAAIHKRFYPKKDGRYLEPLIDPAEQRLPDCPIICQLPEGHGRLVDAELVKEILKPVDSISHYEPEWTWGELHESNCVAIDNAPTIVPAEAERSET